MQIWWRKLISFLRTSFATLLDRYSQVQEVSYRKIHFRKQGCAALKIDTLSDIWRKFDPIANCIADQGNPRQQVTSFLGKDSKKNVRAANDYLEIRNWKNDAVYFFTNSKEAITGQNSKFTFHIVKVKKTVLNNSSIILYYVSRCKLCWCSIFKYSKKIVFAKWRFYWG